MRWFAAAALTAQLIYKLCALALGQSADRLRRRDPALVEDPVRLHPAVLRHGQEHVEDLRRQNVLRRIEEQRMDVRLARLEVLLQLCPGRTNVVGPLEGFHSLVE